MTQPETGVDWNEAGLADRGNEFLRRGNAVAVLCRDARGSATDLSPHNEDGSIRWSPIAADGKWADDLLGIKKIGGYYVTNPEPNQGFINLGAFKDGNGPSWKPKITNDHFMILQDNEPYDTDLTEESNPFTVTPVDTGSPWVQRLYNNRPFSDEDGNSLMEDPGQTNAVYAKLLNGANPGRQFLFLREKMVNGKPIRSVDVVVYAKLDDIGSSKMDKKDSEAADLTYLPIRDQFTMAFQDGEYQPVTKYRIWGGTGYTALGGLPVFSATLPTATAGSGLTATLAFPQPTGPGDPWTYKAQQSTNGGTSWLTAVTPTNVAVASGVVTLTLPALTSGASKLRAVAIGTNGASANSPASASVTIAA